MDISEVLAYSELLVPVAASWMVFRLAGRIRFQLLRASIRVLASVALAAGMVLIFGLSVIELGCSKQGSSIYSRDGQHLAILSYTLQGALGDDYATVSVRSRWIPRAQTVYNGVGVWDFKQHRPADPEVRWLDGSHLLIRSHYLQREHTTCLNRIGEVRVNCESLPVDTPAR